MYRFVDAAVVRVAALPSGIGLPPWPDLTGTTSEDVARWRCWLRQVWACEVVAAAVEVASPVLARRVRGVCAGREQRARQVRGAVVSVMRYLLRMTSRATPLGLFAGVAPVRFGPELRVRDGGEHQVVVRVDTEWLVGVITRLERCPELRCRLPVVANNLAFVRDGRLVVGCQQPTESGRTEPAEVSVRHTRAVETAIQAAGSPIRVGDLAGKLTADFPGTPESVIEAMLAELVARRVLVTSLRPPMRVTDPLGRVVEELAAVGADAVPQVTELFHELRGIHLSLSRHDRLSSPTQRRELRTSASARMACLFTSERPVTVDLRADCTLVLPQVVAREAETAATALVRLTRYPFGIPAWQDYHGRFFLERYGIGALVPLLEILHADAGLGFPARYRDARLTPPPMSGLSERDVRLLALAQNAARDHSVEVVLDEAAIADLAVADVATAAVQPHTELRFRIHAPTPGALERGEFTLALAGVSRAAGTTTGRFLDLFDPADRERMFSAYAGLPTVSQDAVLVQVACPSLSVRAENVARSPAVLPQLVSLGEHHTPGAGVLPLEDLAVSGDARGLYLVSLSRGRRVEPVVFSTVEFTHAAHPLLRFLCEISTARAAACVPFSWGAASRLPFVPRVRYRRTILSPARWILAATDLPGPTAAWPQWVASLAVWRARCRVPEAVYLGESDRRIRLDLEEPAHLYLLRREVDRTGHATVREAPPDTAFGWFAGRVHEIVVPLAATHRPERPPSPERMLHLHHARMAGICPENERACRRLARAAALSWTTRTQAAP
ncbi:MAG: lantibiotic dehydratase family protein [Pseudonocardiaceae bacterium]